MQIRDRLDLNKRPSRSFHVLAVAVGVVLVTFLVKFGDHSHSIEYLLICLGIVGLVIVVLTSIWSISDPRYLAPCLGLV